MYDVDVLYCSVFVRLGRYLHTSVIIDKHRATPAGTSASVTYICGGLAKLWNIYNPMVSWLPRHNANGQLYPVNQRC